MDSRKPAQRRPRHPMPADVRRALTESGLMQAYSERPPYQRNDYLGWILRAKRIDTRQRRLDQMLDELERGDRYMKMPYRARDGGGAGASDRRPPRCGDPA